MRILIVDDNADTKCIGIMEECKKRNIEVEVAKAINPALQRIFFYKGKKIDGIILDLGLPIYENEKVESENSGEIILMELTRKEHYIPVLLFSETPTTKNYIPVFSKMKYWNIEEQKKFFEFIKKLEEDGAEQLI